MSVWRVRLIGVLKWHVESQLHTPEQQDSDLLFPSVMGSFRSPAVLNKPFAEIAEELDLPRFTQLGMRRTYNDLARAAGVIDLVTRSISGHSTEQMQDHYLAGPLGSDSGPQKEKTG